MYIGHVDELTAKIAADPLAKNTGMKVLISNEEGWTDHVMRVVELGVDGHSPKHQHDWPHINYVVEGEGTLFLNGKLNPLKVGTYAYVPSNELHQFANTGAGPFKFICIVPNKGHY